MDKLTAIKIKYDNGTYSDEIPISALAENVEWDSTHTLVDILGSIDVGATGTIQDQISQLFNEKISSSELNNYVANQLNEDVTIWLNNNVNPVGSAVIVDKSLTVEGAAADAKIVGDFSNNLYQSLDILKIQTINIPANSSHSSLIDPITDLNIKTNEDFYFEYNQSSTLTKLALLVFPDSPPKPKTGIQIGINGKLLHEKKLITAPIDIKSLGIYADASNQNNSVFVKIYKEGIYNEINTDFIKTLPHAIHQQGSSFDLNEYTNYGHYSFPANCVFVNGPDGYDVAHPNEMILNVYEVGLNKAGYQEFIDPLASGDGVFYRYMLNNQVVTTWSQKYLRKKDLKPIMIGGTVDFNDYTNNDVFMFGAAPHLNAPYTSGDCQLNVQNRGDGVIDQFATYPLQGKVYMRQRDYSKNWHDWWTIYDSETSDKALALLYNPIQTGSTFDLNTYIQEGFWSFGLSATLLNGPIENFKGSAVYDLKIYKMSAQNALYQELTDTHHGIRWTRYRQSDGVWYDWCLMSTASPIYTVLFTYPFPSKLLLNNRIKRKQIQEIAVYNNHIFDLGSGVMNIDNGEDIPITNGHGNNAMFGKELHGDFPYLYCGSWNFNDSHIYINEVTTNSATLIKTIDFPNLNGYLNMAVDEENDKIYILMNKSSDTAIGDINFVVASLSTGEIISQKDLNFTIPIIQGMEFHNGLIYITYGGISPVTDNYIIALDSNGNIISKSDPLPNFGEIEGISFDNNLFYIANGAYIYY